MATAPVQALTTAKNTGGAASLQSAAFGSSPVSGNSIFVMIWTEDIAGGSGVVTSVTDTTGSNTYVKDTGLTVANSADRCTIYRCFNITGGSNFKVTVNTTGNAYITFTAEEVSGLGATPSLETSNTNTGVTPTQPSTGAITTSTADDFIIATFASARLSADPTVPTSFTRIGDNASTGTNEDGDATYWCPNATQSGLNPTWSSVTPTDSRRWAAIVAAYKPTAGAAATLFRRTQADRIGSRA